MILDTYLKKLGVSSYYDLNNEERKTFKEWESALVGRKITDTEVKSWLEMERESAIASLTSKRLSDREDIFLKMKVDFINRIQGFLSAPDVEKQVVEAQINAQL